MATPLSKKYLEVVQKYYENSSGISINDMNMTEEGKRRLRVCHDAYLKFEDNPFCDLHKYLRNRWQRTPAEVMNDMKVIDFITSFMATGNRKLQRYKVEAAADKMLRIGDSTGDWKALEAGAKMHTKIGRLDQPDTAEDMAESIYKLPIVMTKNVQDKFSNKVPLTIAQKDKLFKQYGTTRDKVQQYIQNAEGVWEKEVMDVSFNEPEDSDEAGVDTEEGGKP